MWQSLYCLQSKRSTVQHFHWFNKILSSSILDTTAKERTKTRNREREKKTRKQIVFILFSVNAVHIWQAVRTNQQIDNTKTIGKYGLFRYGLVWFVCVRRKIQDWWAIAFDNADWCAQASDDARDANLNFYSFRRFDAAKSSLAIPYIY